MGTMLEQLLRARGIDTIILTGVSTEGGIEWTARHAALLGFLPVIAEDAVGSQRDKLHRLALGIMREMYPVLKTRTILKALGDARCSFPK